MKNKQTLYGVVAGVLLVLICSSLVVEKRMHDTRVAYDSLIKESETAALEVAREIGRGGVLPSVKEVILDCPSDKNLQYDELLASLDKGLSASQLSTLNDLFNECGSIPATRRAVMALLLEQEVTLLTKSVEHRALLGKEKYDEKKLASWKDLVTKEKEISTQFYALVNLQSSIIKALVSGSSASSDTITMIQTEVQVVQQKLATATAEASQLRSALVTP